MDSIFSLSYPKYSVATHLAKYFKQKDGYSIYAPLSRQEKGVDLILAKRHKIKTNAITIQVKTSRTYTPEPPKRVNTKVFSFYTWFNRFTIPEEADIFALISIYPPSDNRTKNISSWWEAIILIFSNEEMGKFMQNVKTVKGLDDKMFGFGFDNKTQIFQTRGDQNRKSQDFSNYLLKNKILYIKIILA